MFGIYTQFGLPLIIRITKMYDSIYWSATGPIRTIVALKATAVYIYKYRYTGLCNEGLKDIRDFMCK